MIRRPVFSVLLLGALSVACATAVGETGEGSEVPGAGGMVGSTGGDGSGGEGTGGAGTGGGSTGGGATGGSSTGGAATGGAGSGGIFGSGGASTGGAATGGASTGGAATGGAATGGAATGGASTGGAATGGAATGGTGGGQTCAGAVAWVGGQHSVNYPSGQLFTYMGKVYQYDGTAVMTYVNADCPPDQSGQTWCQTGAYPWSEVTTCP